MITPLDLNNVQLSSGRILERKKPSVVIQEQYDFHEEVSLQQNKSFEEGTSLQQNQNSENVKQENPIKSTPIIEQPSVSISNPHFPERLQIDKGIEKQILLPKYDFIDELKFVCIKIPLLQAIKDIPILAKIIRELSMKKSGRKTK